MARIKCRTPSTGRPLRISQANVTTAYTTISEAPDFSVPDASESFLVRDPLDNLRTIKPGEVFFLTPISAKNKSGSVAWIELQLVTEDSITIDVGRVEVPAGDTAFIPVQGKSLFKRNYLAAAGDKLQVRAQTAGAFDVWGAAEEKLSSEHSGIE